MASNKEKQNKKLNKKKIWIPIVSSIGALAIIGAITGICITQCHPTPPGPVVNSFETDPWSTVLYYANQGIDELHKAYADDCKNNTDFPGTLVGLKRDVYINGLQTPHKIKVIAEGQDFIGDNAASLTFQFDNLISDEEGNYLRTQWSSDRSSGDYWDSPLCSALNSSEDVAWQDSQGNVSDIKFSVYKMIISDPRNEDLVGDNGIKEVSRTVNVYNDGKWVDETQPTRIFCPTIANLFSKTTLESVEYGDYYIKEGVQYKYYAKEVGSGSIDAAYDCFNFKDLNNNNFNSWLSTPSFKEKGVGYDSLTAYHISTDFIVKSLSVYRRYFSIAPCFCI